MEKGKIVIKAHTNSNLGRAGPSIVNTEDEALGVAALNHSTKGEEELSYTAPCCQNIQFLLFSFTSSDTHLTHLLDSLVCKTSRKLM